jgi:hypothetical protein
MPEKRIVCRKTFMYEGLFNYREFFRILDFWQRDKFYDKYEKLNEQYGSPHDPDGRTIYLRFTPWKKYTDFFRGILKVEVMVTGMKEVDVKKGSKKVRMNQGRIEYMTTGYLSFDWEVKMEDKNIPMLYFIRDLFMRYVYFRITNKYYKLVIDDVDDLTNTLQSYLNMHKYKREE